MKYLCVDDENLQLLALVDALRSVDHKGEIVSFSNPLEVIDYINEHQDIDVAFLDISLPEVSGLELAKRIKEVDPTTNLVFVTAFSEYALDAHNLHASGYITKPVNVNKLKIELANLRYPMAHENANAILKAQCFGNFEIFKDNVPLIFARSKSKELLAYLIYKTGSVISMEELSEVLFNESKPSYVRNLISEVIKTLKVHNAEKVFIKSFNGASVDMSLIECDYFDYLNDMPYAIRKYNGIFMKQYKWAKFPKRKI